MRGNRTIKVDKLQLIEKIKANKIAHIEAYSKEVIAYKEEALAQLSDLTAKANNGDLNLDLRLIKPIDNSEKYDSLIEMFTWELESSVELSQQEFNEYVQDETDFARVASLSNSAYIR